MTKALFFYSNIRKKYRLLDVDGSWYTFANFDRMKRIFPDAERA